MGARSLSAAFQSLYSGCRCRLCRNKPSSYLIATEDRMIPPPAQREMSGRAGGTVTEAAASHSVYVSQPAATAAVIEKAASAA